MSCEAPKCYTRKNRKARKDHVCLECGGKIQTGETYVYHSGVWDEPESHKVCVDCEKLRDDMDSRFNYNLDECIAFGEMAECFENVRRHDVFRMRFVEIMRKRCSRVQPCWLEEHNRMQIHNE